MAKKIIIECENDDDVVGYAINNKQYLARANVEIILPDHEIEVLERTISTVKILEENIKE